MFNYILFHFICFKSLGILLGNKIIQWTLLTDPSRLPPSWRKPPLRVGHVSFISLFLYFYYIYTDTWIIHGIECMFISYINDVWLYRSISNLFFLMILKVIHFHIHRCSSIIFICCVIFHHMIIVQCRCPLFTNGNLCFSTIISFCLKIFF